MALDPADYFMRGETEMHRAPSASDGRSHEFALGKTFQQQLDPNTNPEEAVVWDTPAIRDDGGGASAGSESPAGYTAPAGSVYIVPASEDGWTAEGIVHTNWTIVNAGVTDYSETQIAIMVNDGIFTGDPWRAWSTQHFHSAQGGDFSPYGNNNEYEIIVAFCFPNLVAGDQIWVRMRNIGTMLEELKGNQPTPNALWKMRLVPPA